MIYRQIPHTCVTIMQTISIPVIAIRHRDVKLLYFNAMSYALLSLRVISLSFNSTGKLHNHAV